jgi:hypothetical protein
MTLVRRRKKSDLTKPSEGLVLSENRLGQLEQDPAPNGNCGITEELSANYRRCARRPGLTRLPKKLMRGVRNFCMAIGDFLLTPFPADSRANRKLMEVHKYS